MKSIIMILLLIGCQSVPHGNIPKTPSRMFQMSQNSAFIQMTGMVCGNCVVGIEKNFSSKAEVSIVKVDLESETAFIQFKADKTLDDKKIRFLVEERGLELVSIKRSK